MHSVSIVGQVGKPAADWQSAFFLLPGPCLNSEKSMSDENRMLSLPAPSVPSEVAVERPTVYQTHVESSDADAAAVPLSHYLWLLNREKWKLLIFVVSVVAATVIVSSRMTPYYQSTATIDVDRMMPTGVLGQDANANRVSVNDSEQFPFHPGETHPVRLRFAASRPEVQTSHHGSERRNAPCPLGSRGRRPR